MNLSTTSRVFTAKFSNGKKNNLTKSSRIYIVFWISIKISYSVTHPGRHTKIHIKIKKKNEKQRLEVIDANTARWL